MNLSPVAHFSARLRDLGAEWTGLARAGRALRAGISAREVLLGEQGAVVESPKLNIYNKIYVVLRAAPPHLPGWTTSLKVYRRFTHTSDGHFHRLSVSHAFPSRAEAEAYVLGARAEWPPQYETDQ